MSQNSISLLALARMLCCC